MKESDKMFSFFHRTPKIVLDCLTAKEFVYEYTPIVRATKTYPDYWKELPNSNFYLEKNNEGILTNKSIQNLKNCAGLLDFFKKGISIRHWTDMYIETSEEKYDYYLSSCKLPEQHARDQIGKGFENYHHIKLISPWYFREKSGVNFSWIGSEWNLDQYDFKILPAVINFRVNHATNINIMMPKRDSKFTVPVGQPLVTLIPLVDKEVIIKNHLVSESEFIIPTPAQMYFYGWKTCNKLLQKSEKSDKICPFGFGE